MGTVRIFWLAMAVASLASAQGGPGRGGPPVSFDCVMDGTAVNAVTGEPVPRARLRISVGAAGAETSTDNGGKWSFPAAPCGPMQLMASRPGFLPYLYGQRQGRPSTPTTLFVGRAMHDVKLELVPQAVVTGRVLDDAGDPVVNATISVLAARVTDGRFTFQRTSSANTNDVGEFRIANMTRGRYILCAHRNGGPANFPGTGSPNPQDALGDSCYPGPVDGGISSTMELAAGRDQRVDFNLVHVPNTHVRGRVTGQPPGRGVAIGLARAGDASGAVVNYPGAAGPDGRFDIPGVTPGAYVITGNFIDGTKRYFAHVPVNVGQADVEDITVRMEEGFSLAAVVRLEASTDPPPAPPQFNVTLRPSEAGVPGPQVKWADDHRSLVLSSIGPGDYRLIATPPPPFYVKRATVAGQDILRTEAPLGAGSGEIEIVLSDDGGAIEGDVVDAIMANPAGGGILAVPRSAQGSARPLTGFASAGGYFRLQNVPPGDYTLYAWDNLQEVAWADADWMRRYAGQGQNVTVTPRQKSQTKLTRLEVPSR